MSIDRCIDIYYWYSDSHVKPRSFHSIGNHLHHITGVRTTLRSHKHRTDRFSHENKFSHDTTYRIATD